MKSRIRPKANESKGLKISEARFSPVLTAVSKPLIALYLPFSFELAEEDQRCSPPCRPHVIARKSNPTREGAMPPSGFSELTHDVPVSPQRSAILHPVQSLFDAPAKHTVNLGLVPSTVLGVRSDPCHHVTIQSQLIRCLTGRYKKPCLTPAHDHKQASASKALENGPTGTRRDAWKVPVNDGETAPALQLFPEEGTAPCAS